VPSTDAFLCSVELLLNLAWLLLAIPAYLLWRNSTPGNRRHRFSSLQCLLALGCALVLLFPVISATDDLHAMRAEMEESPASKRNILHASAEKNPVPHPPLQNPPALVADSAPGFGLGEFAGAYTLTPSLIAARPTPATAGRAPPAPSLA
jgi:hypothetical protein